MFFRALYVIFGLAIIGYTGYASWQGLEPRQVKKQLSQPGVRGAAGGGVAYYRGGYRGGK